jgi:hypothetical protein
VASQSFDEKRQTWGKRRIALRNVPNSPKTVITSPDIFPQTMHEIIGEELNFAILRIRLKLWLHLLMSFHSSCMKLLTFTFNYSASSSFNTAVDYLFINQSITQNTQFDMFYWQFVNGTTNKIVLKCDCCPFLPFAQLILWRTVMVLRLFPHKFYWIKTEAWTSLLSQYKFFVNKILEQYFRL